MKHQTTASSPVLAFKHIRLYENGQADYLGYPLRLTPVEYAVLHGLIRAALSDPEVYTAAIAVCGWVDAHRTSVARTPILPPPLMSARQLSVHVHRINQKAVSLGNRPLILSQRYRGYRLNPCM